MKVSRLPRLLNVLMPISQTNLLIKSFNNKRTKVTSTAPADMTVGYHDIGGNEFGQHLVLLLWVRNWSTSRSVVVGLKKDEIFP